MRLGKHKRLYWRHVDRAEWHRRRLAEWRGMLDKILARAS